LRDLKFEYARNAKESGVSFGVNAYAANFSKEFNTKKEDGYE